MSTVVGDAWVTLEASGGSAAVVDPVAADALLADLVATVAAAGAPSPRDAGQNTASSSEDCELVLPVASVRAIRVTPGPCSGAGGGGWSDLAEARLNAANEGCRWAVGDANSATVGWIRDGRWAYDRASGRRHVLADDDHRARRRRRGVDPLRPRLRRRAARSTSPSAPTG